MKQLLNFTANMTHPFLKYAEDAQFTNQKVIELISDLRNGLLEEEVFLSQNEHGRLNSQKQKNVTTCYCIMLYIECFAHFSDNHELYDRFIDGWLANRL